MKLHLGNHRLAVGLLAALLLLSCASGLARAAAAGDPGGFLEDLTERAVAQLTEPGLGKNE